MNGLLIAFLLTDAKPEAIMNRIEIVETIFEGMPAGGLRDTLFDTIGMHRTMMLDLDPSLGGRC